ncbi:MAG: GAF domain-containing protein [Candidatus Tectimicrobiota bacterium]
MNTGLDIVSQIIGHRLKQEDIQQLLQALSVTERDDFVTKVAGILSKIAVLLEVSNRVGDTLSLDVLLQRMMDITTAALQAERSTLFLHDPERRELYVRVTRDDAVHEVRLPDHVGIAGAAFTQGKAIIVPDAYADPRFNREVDRQTGYRTRNILCAPIKTRDNMVIGVTQLLNKHEGQFTADDLVLLEAITSQAAAALQNAQLFEQVQRARHEETQLLEVTTAISTELQLQPLLTRIMDTTTTILQADRSTLFMYDEKTQELWSRVAQGEESREIRFPCHLGIAGSVFTTGQTINIPEAYADARFNPDVDKRTGYRTHSILCMPVINKEGKTIGVTQVLNRKGGPFTHLDEKRLKAFSAQASIAIENATLFNDVLNMKNYNESILDSLSNGVVTLDSELRLITCNQAGLRILKTTPEDILGVSASTYFTDANAWIMRSIERVFASFTPDTTMDTEVVLPQGGSIAVNLTVAPLVDIHQTMIGAMLVFEDITHTKRVKNTLARYMSKEVAEKMLEEGEGKLGGQTQEVSILFSDIRDFTSIAEKLGAQETVSMLNAYFSLMDDCISRYGGILNKYMGDAILAVFGAPFSSGKDADRAVKAAIDMMRLLQPFNTARLANGQNPINIGIGISTDEVLSGNIGSMKRMDYTVIGDGVNVAARLESANKYYKTNILVSEFTFSELQDTYIFREIDSIQVKGKSQPVGVYEILDFHDEQSFPNLHDTIALYREGLRCYRQRQWQESIDYFQRALLLNEHDEPSRVYLSRCWYFRDTPPDASWDGVWVMESK